MKLQFPLYLVIDPTTTDASALWTLANFAHLASFIGERHADRSPVLYTDEGEATADARARLAARAPEWVPLSSLRAGAVFLAQTDWRGVKTNEVEASGGIVCTSLSTGKRLRELPSMPVKEIHL